MNKTMPKPMNSAEILDFPLIAKTEVPASPNKNDPLYKKAYTAYHSAKGRCRNPNNASYPDYGGVGIKFLYDTFAEFLADPALPPNKSATLDRKDPSGHYEPGNMRWVPQHVQNDNKKKSYGKAVLSVDELVAQHEAAGKAPQARADNTVAWLHCLAAFRRGGFLADDPALFRLAKISPAVLTAGFKMGQVRDLADEPSYFHLPSLTWPGHAVRMRGGPFDVASPEFDASGTLRALGYFDPSWNIPPELIAAWKEDANSKSKSGAAWVGQVSHRHLLAGGVEGWMLAMASRLRYRSTNPVIACFIPAASLVRRLAEVGGPWLWDQATSPVLDDRILFVPDLQLDVGAGYDLAIDQFNLVAKLLAYRRKRGFKTFVGVQNPHKLGNVLQAEVFGHLGIRELDKLWPDPTSTASITTSNPSMKKLPNGTLGFDQVRDAMNSA